MQSLYKSDFWVCNSADVSAFHCCSILQCCASCHSSSCFHIVCMCKGILTMRCRFMCTAQVHPGLHRQASRDGRGHCQRHALHSGRRRLWLGLPAQAHQLRGEHPGAHSAAAQGGLSDPSKILIQVSEPAQVRCWRDMIRSSAAGAPTPLCSLSCVPACRALPDSLNFSNSIPAHHACATAAILQGAPPRTSLQHRADLQRSACRSRTRQDHSACTARRC